MLKMKLVLTTATIAISLLLVAVVGAVVSQMEIKNNYFADAQDGRDFSSFVESDVEGGEVAEGEGEPREKGDTLSENIGGDEPRPSAETGDIEVAEGEGEPRENGDTPNENVGGDEPRPIGEVDVDITQNDAEFD